MRYPNRLGLAGAAWAIAASVGIAALAVALHGSWFVAAILVPPCLAAGLALRFPGSRTVLVVAALVVGAAGLILMIGGEGLAYAPAFALLVAGAVRPRPRTAAAAPAG